MVTTTDVNVKEQNGQEQIAIERQFGSEEMSNSAFPGGDLFDLDRVAPTSGTSHMLESKANRSSIPVTNDLNPVEKPQSGYSGVANRDGSDGQEPTLFESWNRSKKDSADHSELSRDVNGETSLISSYCMVQPDLDTPSCDKKEVFPTSDHDRSGVLRLPDRRSHSSSSSFGAASQPCLANLPAGTSLLQIHSGHGDLRQPSNIETLQKSPPNPHDDNHVITTNPGKTYPLIQLLPSTLKWKSETARRKKISSSTRMDEKAPSDCQIVSSGKHSDSFGGQPTSHERLAVRESDNPFSVSTEASIRKKRVVVRCARPAKVAQKIRLCAMKSVDTSRKEIMMDPPNPDEFECSKRVQNPCSTSERSLPSTRQLKEILSRTPLVRDAQGASWEVASKSEATMNTNEIAIQDFVDAVEKISKSSKFRRESQECKIYAGSRREISRKRLADVIHPAVGSTSDTSVTKRVRVRRKRTPDVARNSQYRVQEKGVNSVGFPEHKGLLS
jgi:hypothetical protein